MDSVIRAIPGWPGYFASGDGSIWSFRGKAPIQMKPKRHTCKPYLYVTISNGAGLRICPRVHKLVALAFHGEAPAPGMELRHLNGNSLDNRPNNLAWGTRSQNRDDSRRLGTLPMGERTWCAKITEAQAIEILTSPDQGKDLAARFGISKATVSAIRTRRIWRHLDVSRAAA